MVTGSEQHEIEIADPVPDLQVLVADDSPVYRKLVEDALYYQPYSIIHAKSGREAIDLYTEHSPPIVITDWVMPDLSGLDLCKRIRGESGGSYTYIILLTTMSDSESLVRGLEAGADEFLTKPFDPAELQARMGVGRRIALLHEQVEARDKRLAETSRTDLVSGLPNQIAVREFGTWALKCGAVHHFTVSVGIIDVDSFSAINDKFGRSAGDAVLSEFGKIAVSILKPSDVIGRVGDDEFCFVTTHASREELASTLEALREAFARHEFRFVNRLVTATASFGAIASDGVDAPEFLSVFFNAQRALNEAKQSGGNQFRILSSRTPK